jgi:hypothetical protein
MKEQIEMIMADLTMTEKIAVLESLCKKYRRQNSMRINAKQMGRRVDGERPDLIILKNAKK